MNESHDVAEAYPCCEVRALVDGIRSLSPRFGEKVSVRLDIERTIAGGPESNPFGIGQLRLLDEQDTLKSEKEN
jgi:hypothetical protein